MIIELGIGDIDRVLYSDCFGHLGCHSRDCTYVVPMTYVYDGSSIISHTGAGLKVRMMRENRKVCFAVDHVDGDGSWQSVIVHGRFEELHGEEARAALQRLLDHLDNAELWRGVAPTHGAGRFVPGCKEGAGRPEVIFRINIDDKSGRAERTAARMIA